MVPVQCHADFITPKNDILTHRTTVLDEPLHFPLDNTAYAHLRKHHGLPKISPSVSRAYWCVMSLGARS